MDSGSANIGSSHLQNGSNDNFSVDFLGSIQNFANNADQDDMQQFLHPDLFENPSQGQDFNAGMQQHVHQQPQQSRQSAYPSSAFDQNVQRTQSPSMQSYSQTQQFSQHSQYPQALYDQRNMFQQTQYDPRLFQQRPSHSPAPNDQYTFAGQTYSTQNAQSQMMQQRPTASPAPQYHPGRQSIYASYGNFDTRGPTLPQRQDTELMQFASFQNGNQPTSHSFVDPSMLNAQHENLNGSYGAVPHRQMQQQYYNGMQPSYTQQQQQQQQMQTMGQTMQPQHMQTQMPQYTQTIATQAPPKAAKDPNAPKRPRGRPRKDGTVPRTDGTGSTGSATSSDLEFEDEEPEPTPAMISVSLPTDERVKYPFLAVKAVWSPRNKPASVEKIRSGISEFGETIRSLRDAWKARNDQLKKAELEKSPTASDAPRLKGEVAQYRQTAETLMNKSLLFAHPSVLKSLGENLYTLSAMYSFMLDRVTAVDYESNLLLAMLKIGEKFTTLDEDKLENSKWVKLLQRLSKKGTGEIKALAQSIMDKAKEVTANNKQAKANGDVAAGVKRARDGEVAGPATKRVVKTSSKPLALQAAEKRRAQEALEAAKKVKAPAATGTLITPAAAKPKAPLAAAPKTSPFAALMSASKKPGTTNAERAAATKKDGTSVVQQVKKEPLKRDSPPASAIPAATKGPGFFSSLFTEEKKEASPKKEDEIPNESPEQKAKRLRKESRRKLRVSWKADSELVETRLFTHDPDEEINRGDSAMKDAGDTGKEGEMLKRSMAMQDLDDEEDDGDFDPDAYAEPSEIDFSNLASEDCNPDENGIKHGGNMKAESKAAEAQEKLEESSIMAMYASASDRPDTPKEAPDEGDDDFQPSDEFGDPEAKVRVREKEIYALRRPQGFGNDGHSDFVSSLQAMSSSAPSQQYISTTAQTNSVDLLSQLTAMGLIPNQPVQQPQQPQPPAFDLASLVANFSGQNAAPQYQQPQEPVVSAQPDSLQAIMARLAQGQNTTNPVYEQTNDYDAKKGKKTKRPVPKDEKGRPLNYKTKTCEFWEKGTCLYGDDCNYRHSK